LKNLLSQVSLIKSNKPSFSAARKWLRLSSNRRDLSQPEILLQILQKQSLADGSPNLHTTDGSFAGAQPPYLKCHAERELAKPDNWIELTEENISALTFRDVRRAKHLIGQYASAEQHRGIR